MMQEARPDPFLAPFLPSNLVGTGTCRIGIEQKTSQEYKFGIEILPSLRGDCAF